MISPHRSREKEIGFSSNTLKKTSRLVHDPGMRVRVGDDLSPVIPGDPAPGGKTYRAGQYAPHVDDLAISTFSSAETAGILPSGLPIFDEEGNIDKDKLDNWNPSMEGLPVSFADDIPVYSSLVVTSVLKQLDEEMLSSLNLSIMQAPRVMGDFGNYIVSSRTSGENRRFSSVFYVYPDFYKFIDKPVVPKTPKRESGLSISTFMTFHSLGHVVFSKLSFDGHINEVAIFVGGSGWTKSARADHDKGMFMGRKSTSAWYRNSSHRFLTELSKYSPLDDFAQAFALYYTSSDYFQKVDPEKYNIVHKIVTRQV
jgi:hypothetical protein